MLAQQYLEFCVPVTIKKDARPSEELFNVDMSLFKQNGVPFGKLINFKMLITEKSSAVSDSVQMEVFLIA